jgi:hypothetical protein
LGLNGGEESQKEEPKAEEPHNSGCRLTTKTRNSGYRLTTEIRRHKSAAKRPATIGGGNKDE